jgi:hypothetical protein
MPKHEKATNKPEGISGFIYSAENGGIYKGFAHLPGQEKEMSR